jgi:hypothetical protein
MVSLFVQLPCTPLQAVLATTDVVFSQPQNTGAGDQLRTRLITAIDMLKVRATHNTLA